MAAIQIRRRLGLSIVVIAIAAAATASTVFLVADANNRNEITANELASPAARSITIRAQDPDLSPLPRQLVDDVARLPGVTNSVMLGTVRSTDNVLWKSDGNAVGLFTFEVLTGQPPFTLDDGRIAAQGEVMVSVSARAELGIAPGAPGRIKTQDGLTLPVVGTYSVHRSGGIHDLIVHATLTPALSRSDATTVTLLVAAPADIGPISAAARVIFGAWLSDGFTIANDKRAAAVDQTVRDNARSAARTLAVGSVGTGAAIIGLVAFIHATVRRRDIARQRALGRTRFEVLATLTAQIAGLTALGAFMGAVSAAAFLDQKAVTTRPSTLAATVTFITIAGAVGTVPGGAVASLRDPASVLRVP